MLQPWESGPWPTFRAFEAVSSHIRGSVGSENLCELENYYKTWIFRCNKPKLIYDNLTNCISAFSQWFTSFCEHTIRNIWSGKCPKSYDSIFLKNWQSAFDEKQCHTILENVFVFLISESLLEPCRPWIKHPLVAPEAFSSDVQGWFRIENVLMRVVPLLKK